MPVDVISFGGVDAIGKPGNVVYHFDGGLPIASLQSWADQHAPLLDDICGLLFTQVRVTLSLTLPGSLKVAPYAGALASVGANMAFDAAGTSYSHSIRVPAIAAELIGDDGAIIATGEAGDGNTTPNAWASQIVAGLTGPPAVNPTNKYSNDLTSFLGGQMRPWKA